jgi:hypothetical protein
VGVIVVVEVDRDGDGDGDVAVNGVQAGRWATLRIGHIGDTLSRDRAV